jgi:hypothetical protein
MIILEKNCSIKAANKISESTTRVNQFQIESPPFHGNVIRPTVANKIENNSQRPQRQQSPTSSQCQKSTSQEDN